MAWVVGIGVALFLLFAFPRQVGLLILLVVAAGVVLWAVLAVQANNQAQQRASLVAAIGAGTPTCNDSTHPLMVSFDNETGKVVTLVRFRVAGHYPGHSTDVVSDYLSWDQIMQPRSLNTACWAIYDLTTKALPATAFEWTVEVTSVTTQD